MKSDIVCDCLPFCNRHKSQYLCAFSNTSLEGKVEIEQLESGYPNFDIVEISLQFQQLSKLRVRMRMTVEIAMEFGQCQNSGAQFA
jgi:hypothetical protein